MRPREIKAAMLKIHPDLQLGRDYLPRITVDSVEFPFWRYSKKHKPTIGELESALVPETVQEPATRPSRFARLIDWLIKVLAGPAKQRHGNVRP